MSKRNLILAAAALLSALGAAGAASSSALDCSGGELTLDRFALADCSARIPFPDARPQLALQAPAVEPAEPQWEYIETAGAAPGETRRVRLVGTRFLPDSSETIDFRGLSESNVDPINALVHRAAAYFASVKAQGGAVAAVAADAEVAQLQEARVVVELTPLRN